MFIPICSIACLLFFAGLFLFVTANIVAKKDRKDRLAYIRGFKKGQCGIVYIPALVLYWMGYCYTGDGIWLGLFNAIDTTGGLLVLGYTTDRITELMNAEALYAAAVYVCFVLVLLNAILFTLSLTLQSIWCWRALRKAKNTKNDRLILIGINEENTAIYRSDRVRTKLILEDLSGKDSKQVSAEKEALYLDKMVSCFCHDLHSEIRQLLALALKRDKECIFVVNTHDDKKNLSLCRTIVDALSQLPDEEKDAAFLKLKVFVFGDPRYETIYTDAVKSAFGCIHYVNKYLKIAMDFIDKYPFARFMDETQIDYRTSLVKKDVDINTVLIGFGQTNQQIFLTSVANNQFLTGSEENPEAKKVKYSIFDKDPAENNKNLNHNYYRYRNECWDHPGDFGMDEVVYLPLPARPAEEAYYHLDINDSRFYNQIKAIVTANPQDANFVIISFGTDLENLDMAQKLAEKRSEWGVENLVIFVKVRAWQKAQTFLEDDRCYFIGHEQDVVYNIDKLLGDDLFHMAQMRNEVYDLEYTITHTEGHAVSEQALQQNHDNAIKKWYKTKSQMERESSLYCCLSLRSKLNLMGLDYCKRNGPQDTGLSEEEYLRIYAGNDLPDTGKYTVKANGKPIVSYTLDFQQSRRRTMAIHEHQRWNSFMISKGMIPATIAQIRDETNAKGKHTNGKNYALRRHGNLTTFDGLVTFRQLLAKRDAPQDATAEALKAAEAEADVIKYDYQILDDAHWLLTAQGYKIVLLSENRPRT